MRENPRLEMSGGRGGGFGIGFSDAQILSHAAQLNGWEAVGSETHGLAQRGAWRGV